MAKMTEADWKRVVLHIPVGMLGVLFILNCLPVGIVFCLSTWLYEVMDDWRSKDKSFKDVLGICWGYGLGGLVIVIYKLFS